MDVEFDDELHTFLLMSSLSESWEISIVLLSNSSVNGIISLNTVRGILLHEKLWRKKSAEKFISDGIMIAKARRGMLDGIKRSLIKYTKGYRLFSL